MLIKANDKLLFPNDEQMNRHLFKDEKIFQKAIIVSISMKKFSFTLGFCVHSIKQEDEELKSKSRKFSSCKYLFHNRRIRR